ncbi:MAG TPA: hypothetical protein VJB69_02670 [Candidatus Paceibacterota bacterium]
MDWLLGDILGFAKPRKNMKKLMTEIQAKLYDTRMLIELNFRNLKMLYNLVTSFPRSIDGYFANYIYSILAFVLGWRNCLKKNLIFDKSQKAVRFCVG